MEMYHVLAFAFAFACACACACACAFACALLEYQSINSDDTAMIQLIQMIQPPYRHPTSHLHLILHP